MRPVIFDCDGVLIDSEAILVDVEMACLAEIGLRYEREAYIARFLGGSEETYYGGLDADHQRLLGRALPADFKQHLRTCSRAALDARLTAIPGVAHVIARIPIKAVASSSTTANLNRKLQQVGLFDAFAPHIYSTELVRSPKPAPDLFLHAAQALGVKPDNCLAVEDSANGVRSACAAGMTVIGFTGGGHCPPSHGARLREAGAITVVTSMPELTMALDLYQETP